MVLEQLRVFWRNLFGEFFYTDLLKNHFILHFSLTNFFEISQEFRKRRLRRRKCLFLEAAKRAGAVQFRLRLLQKKAPGSEPYIPGFGMRGAE